MLIVRTADCVFNYFQFNSVKINFVLLACLQPDHNRLQRPYRHQRFFHNYLIDQVAIPHYQSTVP